MNTDFLKEYITNEQLIDLVNTIINQEEVYVIKHELYKTTDFRERVYLVKDEIPNPDNYDKISVKENFEKLPCRKFSKISLAKHSEMVLKETKKLLDSISNLYDGLDTEDFATMYEKFDAITAFKDICLAGAYLHDIGKALIGIDNVQIDDHSYVGGNYIYKFIDDIYDIYDGKWYCDAMYNKLDNIIRWHMGFVIDKETHSFIAERKPEALKYMETYLVSMADWRANTPGGRRRKLIDKDVEQFTKMLSTKDYRVSSVERELVISNSKFHLAIR